jgi:hypothetical protein
MSGEWYLIKSQQGSDQLIVDKMIYRVDRQQGDSIYFKCIGKGCGGRAIYRVSANILIIVNTHIKVCKYCLSAN